MDQTIKKIPSEIKKEYLKGVEFKNSIHLFENAKKCNNFVLGRQWEGVNAPDLPKPVFNVLKRVVDYFVSMIVSDDISSVVTETGLKNGNNSDTVEALNTELGVVIEQSGFKHRCREMLKDCATFGDGCFYMYYNQNANSGQPAKGKIDLSMIGQGEVFFANTTINEVQKQPFIMIAANRPLEEVVNECIANNIPFRDYSNIKAEEDGLVTVLLKMYKDDKSGNVLMLKTTFDCLIKQEWDTKLKLYPVAFMNWDKVQGCYHGQSAVLPLIPNQIYINKLFAMSMVSLSNTAFPKIVYDKTRIRDWDNRVGSAIGVVGGIETAVAKPLESAEMSPQVLRFIEQTISYTKDLMGAPDAVLGNVEPNNTSAIIAVQKSTALSMQVQKQNFYKFVEDCIRIFIDMIRAYYGKRYVFCDGEYKLFDFNKLLDVFLNINVEVGESAYWSEIMQSKILDKLYEKGDILASDYIMALPKGSVNAKMEELILNKTKATE